MAVGIKTKIDMESVNKVKQDHKQLLRELKDFTNNNPISIKFNDTTKGFKEVDEGFKQVMNSNNNFAMGMGHAIKRVAEYSLAIAGVYSAINQVKEGFKSFNEIDTKLSNISMITGIDKGELQGQAKLWNEQAVAMKTSTTNVAESMEEWLRAGKTIDEANERLKTNIQLSKVSGESNSDVAQKLIKIGNAYNHSAKESENFANKIAFLDTQTSSDTSSLLKSANAVAEIGKQSKVTEDYMLSMIATIQERSGKAPEAVARSIRGILQDLTKVTEAQDKEGREALSKLEGILSKQGIAIRKTATEFKSGEDILKSLASKWNEFGDVTKRTIQQLAGGKSFSEEFNILMNEQNRVLDLNNQLKNSGASLQDKYAKATDNVASKQEQLKAKMEGLWLSLLNSNALQKAIDGVGHMVDVLKYLTVESKATGLAFAGLVGSLIFVTKNFKKVQFSIGETIAFFKLLPLAMAETGGMAALLSTTFKGLIATLTTLFTTPAGLIFLGLATAVGVATYSLNSHIKKQKEFKEQVDKNKASVDALTESIKNMDKESIKSNVEPLEKKQKAYQDLIAKEKEYQEIVKQKGYKNEEDLFKSTSVTGTTQELSKLKNGIVDVRSEKEKLRKELEASGVKFNELTGEIQKVTEAEGALANIELGEKLGEQKQKTQEMVDTYNELSNAKGLNNEQTQKLAESKDYLTNVLNSEKDTVNQAIDRYYELLNTKERSNEQNAEMAYLLEFLKGKEDDLNVSIVDSTGVLSGNIGEVHNRINALGLEHTALSDVAQAEYRSAQDRAMVTIDFTKITVAEAKKRIQAYQAEIKAYDQAINEAFGKTGHVSPGYIPANVGEAYAKLDKYNDALAKLNSIGGGAPSIKAPSSSGGGYMPSGGGSKSKTPKEKKPKQEKKEKEVADLELEVSIYHKLNQELKVYSNHLDTIRAKKNATEDDKEKIRLIQEEIKWIEKKREKEEEIREKQWSEEKGLAWDLKQVGINATWKEVNGEWIVVIDNYKERMQQLVREANSLSGEAKEKAIKNVKEIEEKVKRYTDLVHNEIASTNKEWLDSVNTIKELNKQMEDLTKNKIKEYTEKQKELSYLKMEEKHKKEQIDLEKGIYSVSKEEYEKYKQSKIKGINEEIAKLMDKLIVDRNNINLIEALKSKELELRMIQNKKYEDVKEFQDVFTKVYEERIRVIDSEISRLDEQYQKEKELEEQQKQREQEIEERKNRLKEIADIQKEINDLELKLRNIRQEKDIRGLKKDENGRFQWDYSHNQREYDKVQEDIDKKYEDIAKKQEEYAKWELNLVKEKEKKKREEEYQAKKKALEDEKKHIQDLLQIKNQQYQDELKKLQEKQQAEKDLLDLHYKDIEKLTNKWLEDMKSIYGTKWDEIIKVMEDKSSEVSKIIANMMASIVSAKSAMAGLGSGQSIGGNTLSSEEQYLQDNPDVTEALKKGYDSKGNKITFNSGKEHWENWGKGEGRGFGLPNAYSIGSNFLSNINVPAFSNSTSNITSVNKLEIKLDNVTNANEFVKDLQNIDLYALTH